MTLQLRMLVPILLLALIGLGASLVISSRASDLYQETQSKRDLAVDLTAALREQINNIERATVEQDRVIEMITLFDIEPSWVAFSKAAARAIEINQQIAAMPVSRDMKDLNQDMAAALEDLAVDGAVIYAKQASAEIPTRERINRRSARIRSLGEQSMAQATLDAERFAQAANAAFAAELRELIIGVVVTNLLVILGSLWMVRRTSVSIRKVAAELSGMAGHADQTRSRDEIRHLQAASLAFASRATTLRDFQTQLAATVGSAVAGDYSLRLTVAETEADLAQIAGQMNDLLSGVEVALAEASGVLTQIAKGDLNARITGNYQGVLLTLKQQTNATAEQLCKIVSEIGGATHVINGNMKLIATGSNGLSERTGQQAQSLGQLAASMEELTQAAQETSAGVARARTVSDEAVARALAGDKVADETTRAIRAIQDSAQKIQDVTEVVDSLAFQTNILAINAAVEAARAGEAGKGFAIVAQEVRSLAMRSSDAAKMIAVQTAESVTQINIGAAKVIATREVLAGIRDGIEGLSHAMQDIDKAGQTQLSSFLELAGTIAHLDREMQMNADLAKDSVVAALDVEAKAHDLQDQMAVFRLPGQGQAAPVRAFAAE